LAVHLRYLRNKIKFRKDIVLIKNLLFFLRDKMLSGYDLKIIWPRFGSFERLDEKDIKWGLREFTEFKDILENLGYLRWFKNVQLN